MNNLEMMRRMAEQTDRSALPGDFKQQTPWGVADGWFLIASALASLSGFVEDAQDDDDLAEAIEHGMYLIDDGIMSIDELMAEQNRLWDELRANTIAVGPSPCVRAF